jgi:hypothetical protein
MSHPFLHPQPVQARGCGGCLRMIDMELSLLLLRLLNPFALIDDA